MNPDDDSRDLCGPLLFRIFSLDTMKVTFFAQALLLGLPCATIAFQTPLKREFEPTVSPRRTVLRVQQNDNENVPFSLKDQQKDTGTTNTAEDNDEAPNATAVETKADNIDNETKDAPKVTDVDKAVDIEGREDEVKAFLDAAGAAAGAAATSAARGLFSLLRQAAAESLTTSLPNDERKALMNKLSNQKTRGDSDGDDESMSQSNSVQENVVAANISEAGRSGKDITELDQQSLLEQATMATQERTESDIASQNFENRHYTAKEYSALSEEDKEALRELRKKQGTPSEPDVPSSPTSTAHPILGPVVLDLGHKRIHVLSAGKLGSIPIWNKQRIYRHDRVKGMAADKWKKSMSLGLPGVICLHEDDSGQLCVIDGQHRIGMMTMLREKQREKLREINSEKDSETNTIDFDNIIVEVYPRRGQSENHAQELFLEINKAEPIQLVDMPGVANAKDRKVITEAVDKLYEQYINMFSPSQRCRTPNVNIDNLRNSLFGANVMKKHKLTTSKKLVDWILEQNGRLGEKYENNEEERAFINPKAWKKASANNFYLGLESTWLYQ